MDDEAVYKDLDPERHSEPSGWSGRETARREIAEAQDRFAAEGP